MLFQGFDYRREPPARPSAAAGTEPGPALGECRTMPKLRSIFEAALSPPRGLAEASTDACAPPSLTARAPPAATTGGFGSLLQNFGVGVQGPRRRAHRVRTGCVGPPEQGAPAGRGAPSLVKTGHGRFAKSAERSARPNRSLQRDGKLRPSPGLSSECPRDRSWSSSPRRQVVPTRWPLRHYPVRGRRLV